MYETSNLKLQNKSLSLSKTEKIIKRIDRLLTTLKHFSKGLQSYLGSWRKSLFTKQSANRNLEKTPVDRACVRHLELPEWLPRVPIDFSTTVKHLGGPWEGKKLPWEGWWSKPRCEILWRFQCFFVFIDNNSVEQGSSKRSLKCNTNLHWAKMVGMAEYNNIPSGALYYMEER